jgi:hypothetical protein
VRRCVRRAPLALDFFFPPPLDRANRFSAVVMDRRGAVLRVFPVEDGKWRMRAHVEKLDPDFIDALLAYEDKHFRGHGGSISWPWAAPPPPGFDRPDRLWRLDHHHADRSAP